jgi:cell division septum initiation protein DivIVA
MQEVDKFLDVVIGDYNALFNTIDRLEEEKEQLLNDIMRLKQEIRTIKTNIEAAKNGGEKEVTNLDVIRRISQLEKLVYGKEE